MAKFTCQMSDSSGGYVAAQKESDDSISTEDLLEVLRPAGLKLQEYYQQAIRDRFRQWTGSLAASFKIKENDSSAGYASITVKPMGKHKGGSYARRDRTAAPKGIKNEELLYLLEYGTPRISASHVIEETNEQVGEEIQDIIESGYDDLLKKKGLI